jgi:hypothetical protein
MIRWLPGHDDADSEQKVRVYPLLAGHDLQANIGLTASS